MVNYQLYRTNVLLGGQMKYDLILDSMGKKLVVSNFKITPIDDTLYKTDDIQYLQYTHQANIKAFYKSNISSFYSYKSTGSDYPIIVDKIDDKVKIIDTHIDTYEMGCRRSKYSQYNKQFNFFCPLWIEYLSDDQYLDFEICLYSINKDNEKRIIGSKHLKLNPQGSQYHDNFVKYLKTYFTYLNINNGNEDIINIDLKNNITTISGINVSTGLKEVKKLPNILQNLLSREIPVIEHDNIIIQNFPNNSFISNQLFNFNLCFDIEDILPSFMKSDILGESINVELKVSINRIDEEGNEINELLELRDLYTNYEYIPRKYCGPYQLKGKKISIPETNLSGNENVLSYLKDNQCIYYIDKNKINPQTIHWSLIGDNEYIFNNYEGFAGWRIGQEDSFQTSSHWYANTPDIFTDSFTKSYNAMTWCNRVEVTDELNLDKISILLPLCSTFETNKYTNGLKYEFNTNENLVGLDKINLLLVQLNGSFNIPIGHYSIYDFNIIFKNDKREECNAELKFIFINKNTAIIVGDDAGINQLTYKKTPIHLAKLLEQLKNEDYNPDLDIGSNEYNYVNTLINLLSKNNPWKSLMVISQDSSLDLKRTNSPSQSSNEIEYYKSDNRGPYIYRYFGKIRPTFIKNGDEWFNYRYNQIVLKREDYENSTFFKYKDSKYNPLYPSIGYFTLNKDKESYEISSNSNVWKWDGYRSIIKKIEWNNFNINTLLFLYPKMHIQLKSQKYIDGKYYPVKDLILNYLRKIYHITEQDKLDYIYSLYDYEFSYDYKSVEDIENYIYDVKIILK